MPWITRKDGVVVNTDWFDKDRQIEENKKEAEKREENKWHYPGIKDQIAKIEKSKLPNARKLKAIDDQLKAIESLEQSEGSNSQLLTYRRQLRLMRKKIIENK